jgi:CRISPR-associated endonuclease/helicase Cas3
MKANAAIADMKRVLSDPDVSRRAEDLAQTLATILPEPLKGRLLAVARANKRRLERPVFPYGGDDDVRTGVVLIAPFGISDARPAEDGGAVSTEDDEAGSFLGRAQSLAEHSSDVEARARTFARSAGLCTQLVDDLALAGWLHDAGKADLRFQRLLYDGDLLAMEAGGPRAKSDRGRAPRGAWARAKLPDRWRHEALSVRLALLNARLHTAHDRGLVLWLVGVHHGLGRPFFPHTDPSDGKEREVAEVEYLTERKLQEGAGPQSPGFLIPEQPTFAAREGRGFDDDLRGLDWPTLFRDLKRRYGPWGLARLEAILRLADHRASEAARNREGVH